MLKREVAAAGARARAWINGSPVTTSVLADIGALLVNVHGQHEAQALLDEQSQRAILDVFGECASEASRVAAAHHELQDARAAVDALRTRRDDARQRADYLEHVAREIGEAKLVEGEDARLEDESRRLAHGEELRALAGEIDATRSTAGTTPWCVVSGTCSARCRRSRKSIPPPSACRRCTTRRTTRSRSLPARPMRTPTGIENDPARLEVVERRRDLIGRLIKKYGGSVACGDRAGRSARAELDLLDSAVLDLRELDARAAAAETCTRCGGRSALGKAPRGRCETRDRRRGVASRAGHAGREVSRRARAAAGGCRDAAPKKWSIASRSTWGTMRARSRAWRPVANSRA